MLRPFKKRLRLEYSKDGIREWPYRCFCPYTVFCLTPVCMSLYMCEYVKPSIRRSAHGLPVKPSFATTASLWYVSLKRRTRCSVFVSRLFVAKSNTGASTR